MITLKGGCRAFFSIKEAITFIIMRTKHWGVNSIKKTTLYVKTITHWWEKSKKTHIKRESTLYHGLEMSLLWQRFHPPNDLEIQYDVNENMNGLGCFFGIRVSGSSEHPRVHHVAEGGSELLILLPPLPECGDYRCTPSQNWFINDSFLPPTDLP